MDNNDISRILFTFQENLEAIGYNRGEAFSRSNDLKLEIESTIDDHMAESYAEAAEAGIEKNSEKFLRELRPKPGAFQLETESGNMDFSIPPFPMKDALLRNAKVSSNGNLYKVIPVGKKSEGLGGIKSLIDLQNSQALKNRSDLENRVKASMERKVGSKYTAASDAKPQFKTVSSNQDSSKWQHPGIERDFTPIMNDINRNLEETISRSVYELVQSHLDRARREADNV